MAKRANPPRLGSDRLKLQPEYKITARPRLKANKRVGGLIRQTKSFFFSFYFDTCVVTKNMLMLTSF
jgi:hypothetical protein